MYLQNVQLSQLGDKAICEDDDEHRNICANLSSACPRVLKLIQPVFITSLFVFCVVIDDPKISRIFSTERYQISKQRPTHAKLCEKQ